MLRKTIIFLALFWAAIGIAGIFIDVVRLVFIICSLVGVLVLAMYLLGLLAEFISKLIFRQ